MAHPAQRPVPRAEPTPTPRVPLARAQTQLARPACLLHWARMSAPAAAFRTAPLSPADEEGPQVSSPTAQPARPFSSTHARPGLLRFGPHRATRSATARSIAPPLHRGLLRAGPLSHSQAPRFPPPSRLTPPASARGPRRTRAAPLPNRKAPKLSSPGPAGSDPRPPQLGPPTPFGPTCRRKSTSRRRALSFLEPGPLVSDPLRARQLCSFLSSLGH